MMSKVGLRFSLAVFGFGLATPALAASCLIDPVKINPNVVTSVFGKTRNLGQYAAPQVHWGVDMQARDPKNPSVGADLVAVDNGTVIGAGFWGSGYGNRVALRRENGDIVIYSHLAKVEPELKSGGAVGFKEGGTGVGAKTVAAGQKIGVAGGTADHMSTNQRAIHLHMEYVTSYSGNKLRETNDGTNATRSRYMRNALTYMCHTVPHAPGAGEVTAGTGGTPPVSNSATDDQVTEARNTQPQVTDRERYGIPDAAPYASYEGMSESQIIEAEMLRRTLDTEWEEKLTEWGKRGLWMEIARIHAVKTWLESRIAEKSSLIEGMLSTKLAFQTNMYFSTRLQAAYSRAEQTSAMKRVK